MSCKHKATGTWRFKPNGNKSVAVGNVLLSEAFGVIPEVFRCENTRNQDIIGSLRPRAAES